ncbi:hypothetical protein Zmor_001962 [Zophobas morio]|uniref:Uncharacterized protein n=1 Tax=Zophobas morio TaxID=2755281 RepID=A0AA38IZY1_9CUCU|nr:hypothetical protein Zmor_001962 [Zophobas morio]
MKVKIYKTVVRPVMLFVSELAMLNENNYGMGEQDVKGKETDFGEAKNDVDKTLKETTTGSGTGTITGSMRGSEGRGEAVDPGPGENSNGEGHNKFRNSKLEKKRVRQK